MQELIYLLNEPFSGLFYRLTVGNREKSMKQSLLVIGFRIIYYSANFLVSVVASEKNSKKWFSEVRTIVGGGAIRRRSASRLTNVVCEIITDNCTNN